MSKYPGRVITDLAPAGYSVFFDGNTDVLSAASNAAFAFGTGDFTIEAWINPSSLTADTLLCGVDATGGAILGYSTTTVWLGSRAVSYDLTATYTIPLNTWTHIAVSRQGTTARLFANGVQIASGTVTNNYAQGQFAVGNYVTANIGVVGYLSNVRAVKGTALYTAAFNPPTQLLNITNTSILTCNSPAFVDQSSNAFSLTAAGTPFVSTFTPFRAYVPYNPALGASTPGIWTVDEAMQAAATRQWNMYDPYFNLNTLLLHGNGTNGAQNNTFIDSSSNNFTITRNPASGPNAPTQGSFSPFSAQPGAWSSYYSGVADTNGTYFAANAAYSFGTGDFTVEAWINIPPISNTNGKAIVDSRPSGFNGSYWFFGFTNTGQLTGITMTTGGTTITSTSAIPTNQWVHVAYTRASGTLNLWVNGVSVASATGNTNNISSDTLWVGRNAFSGVASDTWFSGYMSNLRIVKGVAVYTGTFTPPASPLEKTQSAGINIAAITGSQTSLLFNQSNRFVDNSNTNATPLTLNTWPTIQPFSPFYPTAAYTPQTIGGSGYFDGTGDYLRTPSITIGTNAFCFECWFYPTAAQPILAGFFAATTNNALQLSYTNTGAGLGIAQRGVAFRVTGSSIPVVNQWNHIAFVRSGTGSNQTSIFLNGVRIANGTASDNFSASAYDIAYNSGDNAYLTGYISGARLTNGSTPYDATLSTLTIPTAPPTTSASNTVLLLNFTNAGVVDSTGKNALETVGNAQISTTQSKFGGSSMYFDGTGDYLLSPSSQNFAFPGDFTIEFWSYITAVSGEGTTFYVNATGGINIFLSISGNWGIARSFTAVDNNFGTPPTQNTWNHLAVSRAGSTIRAFINGVQVFSGTNTTSYVVGPMQFGLSAFGSITGYIDELRVTKFARYTGNFTPQTSQWQDQ